MLDGRPSSQGISVPGSRKVPAAVPSLDQSPPVDASQASKRTLPPSKVESAEGEELAARPGPIVAAGSVPPGVKSLTNGCGPASGSRPVKTIRPPSAARSSRPSTTAPLGVAARREVPAGAPSVAQRSPFVSTRTRWPAAARSATGPPSQGPGQRSAARRVPAPVPSVDHSSRPCWASRAVKKRRPLKTAAGPPGSGAGHPPGQPRTGSGRFIPGASDQSSRAVPPLRLAKNRAFPPTSAPTSKISPTPPNSLGGPSSRVPARVPSDSQRDAVPASSSNWLISSRPPASTREAPACSKKSKGKAWSFRALRACGS